MLSENPVVNQMIDLLILMPFSVGHRKMNTRHSLFCLFKDPFDFGCTEFGRVGFIKNFNGVTVAGNAVFTQSLINILHKGTP